MLQAQMEERSRLKHKRQQPAKRRGVNVAANAEYPESQPRGDRGHLFKPATHAGGGNQFWSQQTRQKHMVQFRDNAANLPTDPGHGNPPNFPMQLEHVHSSNLHTRPGHANTPNWSTGTGTGTGHVNPPNMPVRSGHVNARDQRLNFGRFQSHPSDQLHNERERFFRGHENFREHQPAAADHGNASVFPQRDGPPMSNPDKTDINPILGSQSTNINPILGSQSTNPILGSQPRAPSVPRFNWPPGAPQHADAQPERHLGNQHMGDPARPRGNVSARSDVENNSNMRGAMNDLSKRQKQLKQREWLDHQKREREMAAEKARAEKIQQRARIRELRRKRTPRRPANDATATNTRTTGQSPGYMESPRTRGVTNAQRPPQPPPDPMPSGPAAHGGMYPRNMGIGASPNLLGHGAAHSDPHQSHLQSGSPRGLAHDMQSQPPRAPPTHKYAPHMQRNAAPPHSHATALENGNEFGAGKFSGRGNRSDPHDAPSDRHWGSQQRNLHNPHHRTRTSPVNIHSAQQQPHEIRVNTSPRHLNASPLTVGDPWAAREAPVGHEPPNKDRDFRPYEPPMQRPHPEGPHMRSPGANTAQNVNSRHPLKSNSSRTSPRHDSRHPNGISADSRARLTGDRSPPAQALANRGRAQNILHPHPSSGSPHSSQWRGSASSGKKFREGSPSHQMERDMGDARYNHHPHVAPRVLDMERSVIGPVPPKERVVGWSGDGRANPMRSTQLLNGESEYRTMTAEDALNATRISDDEECMPLQSFSTLYAVNPDQLYQSIAIDFRDKGVPVPESLSSYRPQQKQPAQVHDTPSVESILKKSPTSPGRGVITNNVVIGAQSPGNKLISPRDRTSTIMLGEEEGTDEERSESHARMDPGCAKLSLSVLHRTSGNGGDAVSAVDSGDGVGDGDHDRSSKASPSALGVEPADGDDQLDRTIPRTGPPPGVARQLARSTNAATADTRTSQSRVLVSPAAVHTSPSSQRKALSLSQTSISTPKQQISTVSHRTSTPKQRISTPKQHMSTVPAADSEVDDTSDRPTIEKIRNTYARLDKLVLSVNSSRSASSPTTPTAKSTSPLLRSHLAASPKSRVMSRGSPSSQVLPSFAMMVASRTSMQSVELSLASSLSQLGQPQSSSDATPLTARLENKEDPASSHLGLQSSLAASRKFAQVHSSDTSTAHTVLEPWDELEARRKAQSRFLRHQRLKLTPDRQSRQVETKNQHSPYHSSSTPSSSEMSDNCSSSDDGEARVGSASVLLGSSATVRTNTQSIAGSTPMKKNPALSDQQVNITVSSDTRPLSPESHSGIDHTNGEVNLDPFHGNKAGQTSSGEGKNDASELRMRNMGARGIDGEVVDKVSADVTTATGETSRSIHSVLADTHGTHESNQVQNPSFQSHVSTQMSRDKSIEANSSQIPEQQRRSLSSQIGKRGALIPTPTEAAPIAVHKRASQSTSLNANGRVRAGARPLANNDSRRSRLRRSTRATLMAVRRRELMRESTSRLSLSRSRGSRADFATPTTTPRLDVRSGQLQPTVTHNLHHNSNLESPRHHITSRPPMSSRGSNSSRLTLQQERRLLREREENNRPISK